MRKLSEWVDFMEGEVTLKQIERLTFLLKHSPEDQVILENLRRLRRSLRQADPARIAVETINEPEFLQAFHTRVMDGIKDLKQDRREQRQTADQKEIGAEAHESWRTDS